MPDSDDPFRPPEADLTTPPGPKKFALKQFLGWVFAPLVCAIIGGAIPRDDWFALIIVGFIIIFPCSIVAGVMVANHYKRLGRPGHLTSGLGVTFALFIFDFIALFTACSISFRLGHY